MGDGTRLTAKQFHQASRLDDWRVLASGASAWFDAPSLAAGARLARCVAEIAGGRLPDIDLRSGGVHLRIGPDHRGDLAAADVALAKAISQAAQELDLVADPSALQTVRLVIDALDKPAVMGFWRTALGYEARGDGHLVDAMRRDPAIWLQQQDQPRPWRNRIHVDVGHPYPKSQEWVDAVTAVGGREAYSCEYYATLADPEGNEVDGPVTPVDQVGEAPETADWRALMGAMTFYPVTSARRAVELAAAVAGLADDTGLPLLVDLRPDGVTIDSGKDQWYDEGFLDLSGRVQAVARGMGLAADTTRLRFVQIGIDAADIPAVLNFWRVVLGYASHSDHDIYDPRWLGLPIFFQQLDTSQVARCKQRNRIHLDVYVPDDQAPARIDAALAAGGRIVSDGALPWWTLADPEGNEVDVIVSDARKDV